MIRILFFGDSHTAGDELWEEKFIPNYNNFTVQEATTKSMWNTDIDEIRKQLSYVGFVKQLRPTWEIHNFAKSGASQTIIASIAYTQYTKMRELYPNDKIICVIQNTFRTPYSYYNKKSEKYEGLNTLHLETQLLNHPETDDLIEYAKQFLNDEILGTQFYSSVFGINTFFSTRQVPFLNFSFYNHAKKYENNGDSDSILSIMYSEYLKIPTPFKNGVRNRVLTYYNITLSDAILPLRHIKHKYHEIVAEDIVNYIEQYLL